jgi:two-component system chemotaxis sensor kinase CheA
MAGLHDILGEDFFSQEDELIISKHKLIEIEKKISMLLTPNECKMLIPELRKLRHRPFDTLLKSYPDYVLNMAERLEKLIYPVVMNTETILVNPDFYSDFTKSLVHVFRNAVDHGLEAPDERLDNDKDEYGKIHVSLTSTEKHILLTIKDDGRGIDAATIRDKLVESGLKMLEEVEKLTDAEAVQLIFADGFSTKEDVNELSGRGVGLAAVFEELTKLGGFLTVQTEINQGTEFAFNLPKETDGVWGVSIAELMQPLINTTCQFFLEQANLTVTYQDSFWIYEPKQLDLYKVTAIINIRGALEITFILSFDEPVLREIVRNFVIDELTPEEVDQYLEDVLTEVTNIILGNSLKEFPGREELVIIDTPISISSDEVLVKYLKAQIWNCQMQTELGNLSLSLVIPLDINVNGE